MTETVLKFPARSYTITNGDTAMYATNIRLIIRYATGEVQNYYYSSPQMANEMAQSLRMKPDVLSASVIG